jgi:hypothetical protein
MAQLPLARLFSVALVTIVSVLALVRLSTHRLIHRASHDLEGQKAGSKSRRLLADRVTWSRDAPLPS